MSIMAREMSSMRKEMACVRKQMEEVLKVNQSQAATLSILRGQVDTITAIQHQVEPPPIEDNIENIPEKYCIPDEELTEMNRECKSAGNFGGHLVKLLFPELFGPNNLKFFYNWNGGGKLMKKELDQTRKMVIRKYVTHFHPSVRAPEAWRNQVVPKINELLRRKDKIRPPLEEIDMSDEFTGFTYMNL